MTEAIEIVGRASMVTTDTAVDTAPPKLPLRRKTSPERGDPRFGQSSVTNGRHMHIDPDAGTASWQRRYKDIFNLIAIDSDDEGARQQARRVAMIALVCERYESELAAGKTIDLGLYGTMSDRFSRAIEPPRSAQ
jgi:hypothetical protein